MKRLLRRAFNLVAAMSAVLFVMTCALWARSYGEPGFVERSLSSSSGATALQRNWCLFWSDGRFHLRSERRFERYNDPEAFPTWTGARWSWGPYEIPPPHLSVMSYSEREPSIWERLGFSHYAVERNVPLEDLRIAGLIVRRGFLPAHLR